MQQETDSSVFPSTAAGLQSSAVSPSSFLAAGGGFFRAARLRGAVLLLLLAAGFDFRLRPSAVLFAVNGDSVGVSCFSVVVVVVVLDFAPVAANRWERRGGCDSGNAPVTVVVVVGRAAAPADIGKVADGSGGSALEEEG